MTDQIRVVGDYGKDDSTLSAGWYAEGANHIAGPAPDAESARAALVAFVREEGFVMPGERFGIHTWKVTKP